ncbi:MAG: hypothetical protein IT207_07200, partial [Fimbriimonadaceae bacterium]|nr:hypothetical protein [Fimbriimonadaceae bacterium]
MSVRGHLIPLFVLLAAIATCQTVKDSYDKYEYMVPARDGTRLYVSVYVPKAK